MSGKCDYMNHGELEKIFSREISLFKIHLCPWEQYSLWENTKNMKKKYDYSIYQLQKNT